LKGQLDAVTAEHDDVKKELESAKSRVHESEKTISELQPLIADLDVTKSRAETWRSDSRRRRHRLFRNVLARISFKPGWTETDHMRPNLNRELEIWRARLKLPRRNSKPRRRALLKRMCEAGSRRKLEKLGQENKTRLNRLRKRRRN